MQLVKCSIVFIFGLVMLMAFKELKAQDLVRRAFPYHDHIHYASTTIKPAIKQDVLDKQVGDFYKVWKKTYVQVGRDTNQAYILADSLSDKGKKEKRSISEGHGYGMVIVVLMAGFDPQAQSTYNKLFQYYKAHRCTERGNTLMRWEQKDETDSDNSAASDGDLDVAYSLLLAEEQWGDNTYNYGQIAREMLKDIWDFDINKSLGIVVNSNDVDENSKRKHKREYFSTRSSDFMPAHFRAFGLAMNGQQNWDQVRQASYQVFIKMQSQHPETGLIPDFMVDVDNGLAPAPANFFRDEKIDCSTYNYNACRVPWRLATDFLLDSDKYSFQILSKINNWIRNDAVPQLNPKAIAPGYDLKGKPVPQKKTKDGPDTLHLCYVAPLGVAAMIDKKNQIWLNNIWNYLIEADMSYYRNEDDLGYYDNSIKLYDMIIISGNYWKYTRD